MFAVTKKHLWDNTWWMDRSISEVPEDGLRLFGADVPQIRPGDMETICQPLDFFGFNNYRGLSIRADKDGQPEVAPFLRAINNGLL